MSLPLLNTKFYIPPVGSNLIARARLRAQMDEGIRLGLPFTLITGPAGYGKTTLAAEWLRGLGDTVRVSWLSLDENDNDPARFYAYLVAALQKLDDNIGASVQSLLSGAQPASAGTIMTGLINDLLEARGGSEAFVLALDDYHKIHSPAIHDAVRFLLDNPPPGFHLVIITREDPPLPLARLRVRGRMREIRAQDLRFNTDEVAQFFQQVACLELKEDWLRAIEERTEGWAAGLQLAGLSLKTRSDIGAFLEDFRGSHRYLIDYLMEEVLRLQSEETRTFLYQTSILERFNAALCSAVTRREDCQRLLEHIVQSNLFLVGLDERREWFRYHHLFADFLRTGLDASQKAALHQRAAGWFEEQGLLAEAIQHSLAGKDYPSAGRQISSIAEVVISQGRLETLLGWFQALPEAFLLSDGDLLSLQTWCLYFRGQVEAAMARMTMLETRFADSLSPTGQARLLSLKAWNANARELDETVTLAEQAAVLAGDQDPLLRASCLLPLGHGYRRMGKMAKTTQAYSEAYTLARQAGAYLVAISAFNSLTLALNEQTRRAEALALLEEAGQGLVDARGRRLPIADLLLLGQAALVYEANQLELSRDCAVRARQASQRFLSSRIMGGENEAILVRALTALGDIAAAEQVLAEARQQQNHLRWVPRLLDALEAEMRIKQGDVAAASRWAEQQEITDDSRLILSQWIQRSTYIRVLIAQGRLERVPQLLESLEATARSGERFVLLINIYALQALAHAVRGEHAQAQERLEMALQIAAPGGYTRRILDQGPQMGALLREYRASPRGQSAPPALRVFVDDLLAAFAAAEGKSTSTGQSVPREPGAPPGEPQAAPAAQYGLPERLTEHELKILRLMSAGLSNQDIADALVIGVGTVKWHVHNILGKLGASSRTQAIAKAKEAGLI